MVRRFLSSSAVYVLLTLVARALSVGATLYAFTKAGQVEFGQFSFLQSTALTLGTITSFSMLNSLNVAVAEHRHSSSGDGGGAVEFAHAAFFLVGLIEFGFVCLLISVDGDVGWTPSKSVGIYIFALSSLGQNIYQGLVFGGGRPFIVGWSQVCGNALTAILVLFWAKQSGGLLWANALGSVTSLAFLFSFVRSFPVASGSSFRRAVHFGRQYSSRIFRYGWMSFANTSLIQFALWFLQAELLRSGGGQQNAIFALATQFFNIVLLLPIMLGPVIVSSLAACESSVVRARLTIALTAMFVAISAAGCVLFFVGSPLMFAYLPSKYRSARDILGVSVVTGAITFARTPILGYFQSRLKVMPDLLSSVAASVFVGLLIFIDHPHTASQAVVIRMLSVGLQAAILGVLFIAFSIPHGVSEKAAFLEIVRSKGLIRRT